MSKQYNSVSFIRKNCIGCTRCMRICPNEALRVMDGKVVLLQDKCIDCGLCISACHRKAITVTKNVININNEKYNICLLPLSFYGLYKNADELKRAINAFYQMGFDYVFDTVSVVDSVIIEIQKILNNNQNEVMISSFCPAVTKLVELNYPALVDNIIPIKTIQEIAAMTAIEYKKSETTKEIEVYYFAECPALVQNVYNPIGYNKSAITKVYSLNTVFSDFLRNYKNASNELNDNILYKGKGSCWAAVGGQKKTINSKKVLAIDGINNVINVLELIDEGRLENINYIELEACEEGCLGGIFTIENKYIAKVNNDYLSKELCSNDNFENIIKNHELKVNNVNIFFNKEFENKDDEKTGNDFLSSLKDLSLINEVYEKLPKIDCSGCGSPSCKAMAEDIVKGLKRIEECVFLNINNGRDSYESD